MSLALLCMAGKVSLNSSFKPCQTLLATYAHFITSCYFYSWKQILLKHTKSWKNTYISRRWTENNWVANE